MGHPNQQTASRPPAPLASRGRGAGKQLEEAVCQDGAKTQPDAQVLVGEGGQGGDGVEQHADGAGDGRGGGDGVEQQEAA